VASSRTKWKTAVHRFQQLGHAPFDLDDQTDMPHIGHKLSAARRRQARSASLECGNFILGALGIGHRCIDMDQQQVLEQAVAAVMHGQCGWRRLQQIIARMRQVAQRILQHRIRGFEPFQPVQFDSQPFFQGLQLTQEVSILTQVCGHVAVAQVARGIPQTTGDRRHLVIVVQQPEAQLQDFLAKPDLILLQLAEGRQHRIVARQVDRLGEDKKSHQNRRGGGCRSNPVQVRMPAPEGPHSSGLPWYSPVRLCRKATILSMSAASSLRASW
jgi:hypothetical protein